MFGALIVWGIYIGFVATLTGFGKLYLMTHPEKEEDPKQAEYRAYYAKPSQWATKPKVGSEEYNKRYMGLSS